MTHVSILLVLMSGAILAAASANAAQSMSARALIEEATRHEHAEGRERDYAQAHRLYCQAARMNHPDAFVRMGWMYANGRGVPRNDGVAHLLFSRAAKLGSEIGGRLAGMIQAGSESRPSPPTCLVASSPVSAFPGANAGIGDPARFMPAPNSAEQRKLVATVVAQAREFKIDPRLVFAIMRAESNFDPAARSPKNARGLMQLMPETAERFAVGNVHDPAQNVRGGIRYLRWLLSYFRGDVVLALAGYNSGEGTVDRFGGVPPYAETMAYVARIRALYPHDRHPFDPRVAEASPLFAKRAMNDENAGDSRSDTGTGPTLAKRVRYFLDKTGQPLAQSGR